MTLVGIGADRVVPEVRVLFGTERFSSQHASSYSRSVPAR